MNVWRITLTGVDSSTPVLEAVELYRREMRLELGILFSDSRAGAENRYPEHRWIESFTAEITAVHPEAALALHICGSARRRFLETGDLAGFTALHRFNRIQLNGTFDPAESRLLEKQLSHSPRGPAIITQHEINPALAQAISSHRHQVLFDASGGRGIRREDWPAPIRGKRCGYAGGLGPLNLAQELPRMEQVARGTSVWVDMESGIRDAEDRFSLPAAHRVLDGLAEWTRRPLDSMP